MPSTTNVEILKGQESTATDPSKTATSTATPPQSESEVSGHYWTTRVMECWSCHGLSYVNYDTDTFHNYTCCHCGASNRF